MPQSSHPLVVTADPGLLDDLLRLSAAAGVEPEVASEPAGARRGWAGAPLVVVGDDLAGALPGQGLPRRDGVVVVGLDLDDARVWERAVAVGAEHVVFLPDAETWLAERLADSTESAGRTALVVSVLGGRGGAGASTLAAALAVTGMRRGLRSILVDGDPLGGGLDLLLGGEDTSGVRWPDLVGARGRVSGGALHDALPRVDELTVLSWDRGDLLTIPPEPMHAVLAAAGRSTDLVVVDLPRRLDPAAETALSRCDVGLLVVPAEVRATAAAARVAAAAGLVTPDLQVVVRVPTFPGLPPELIADALGLPLAGALRSEPGLPVAAERGEPPARRGKGPLADFCGRFLADSLAPRNAAA